MIRNRVLAVIIMAVAAGLGLTTPASPARAVSICDSDDPPPACYQDPTDPIDPGDPYGTVTFTQNTNGVVVEGTAGEANGGPVWVDVRVDGVLRSTVTPNSFSYYYSYVFVNPLTTTVCAAARNSAGYSVQLGCFGVHGPVGVVDSETYVGSSILLTGWVLDPDSTEPVTLRVIPGDYQTPTSDYPASQERGDVAARYPAFGAYHGFTLALPTSYCFTIVALNIGLGTNTALYTNCMQ